MTLDELLYGMKSMPPVVMNETNTRTYEVERLSEKFLQGFSVDPLVKLLEDFNASTEGLRAKPRLELYTNFYHRKNDGGYPAMFRGMFARQRRYVPCDNTSLYPALCSAMMPLINQHPAKDHDAIYERVSVEFVRIAKENGLSLERSDFDELLSSAFRKIDAPVQELKEPLRCLKEMFENSFHAQRAGVSFQTTYYHTSAFAYIHGRWTVDAVKRHQSNESKWFAKLDFSNFFGSTTLDYTMRMLSMIFPFCEICKSEHGKAELEKAVELGFLDGILPQGTPLSPTLTNIIMVPIDYRLSNMLRDFKEQSFVYTRYADDIHISSRYTFKIKEIEALINEAIQEFDAPYHFKPEKTHYGSIAGSNWMLGVMLNAKNDITVGWEEKKKFEAMLASYARDRQNGIMWSPGELSHLDGVYSYFKSVEGDVIDRIVRQRSMKFGFDIIQQVRRDLHPAG